MKKTLIALFLGISAVAMAQEEEERTFQTDQRHEFRLDALEALAVPMLEVNYEYIISKYSGVGIAASIALEEDIEDYQKFAITPYYRQYFFNKKDYGARGLFAEGLLQLGSGEDIETIFLQNGGSVTASEDWTQFGIGFALGQKWVSRNGFVLELSIGGGRYIAGDEFGPDGFVRGGVLVGYRF